MFGPIERTGIDQAIRRQGQTASAIIRVAGSVAVVDESTIIGEQCSTCDGYMCLDCAAEVEHAKCSTPCPECVLEATDWDASLEATQIVDELRGLHALDEAITQLDEDEDD